MGVSKVGAYGDYRTLRAALEVPTSLPTKAQNSMRRDGSHGAQIE